MTEAYAYLVRHTHRTFFGLRRRSGRTLLQLAKPIDSTEALETAERLLAGQLRVYPSDLVITGVYPLTSRRPRLVMVDDVDSAAQANPCDLAVERYQAESRRHGQTAQKLTATDQGLYRARALLEMLAQWHPLSEPMALVRAELEHYPSVFQAGMATPGRAVELLAETGKRWDFQLLSLRPGK